MLHKGVQGLKLHWWRTLTWGCNWWYHNKGVNDETYAFSIAFSAYLGRMIKNGLLNNGFLVFGMHCKIDPSFYNQKVKTFHSLQIGCFTAGCSAWNCVSCCLCLVARPSKYSELCIISLTGLVINWRWGLKSWQIAPFKRTMHFLFNYPLSFKSAASIIHGLWATRSARRSSIFPLLQRRASPLFFSSFKFIFMMLAQIITFYTFRQGGRLSLSFLPPPCAPFFAPGSTSWLTGSVHLRNFST
jgi:hypothetical protein